MLANIYVLCMTGSRPEQNKQENEEGLSTDKRNCKDVQR